MTAEASRPPPAPALARNGLRLPVPERRSDRAPASAGDELTSLGRSSSLSRRSRFDVRPALTKQQLKYALAESTDHTGQHGALAGWRVGFPC